MFENHVGCHEVERTVEKRKGGDIGTDSVGFLRIFKRIYIEINPDIDELFHSPSHRDKHAVIGTPAAAEVQPSPGSRVVIQQLVVDPLVPNWRCHAANYRKGSVESFSEGKIQAHLGEAVNQVKSCTTIPQSAPEGPRMIR